MRRAEFESPQSPTCRSKLSPERFQARRLSLGSYSKAKDPGSAAHAAIPSKICCGDLWTWPGCVEQKPTLLDNVEGVGMSHTITIPLVSNGIVIVEIFWMCNAFYSSCDRGNNGTHANCLCLCNAIVSTFCVREQPAAQVICSSSELIVLTRGKDG